MHPLSLKHYPHALLLTLAALSACTNSLTPTHVAQSHASDSQITLGHARFTVITPSLIRIEYSPTGHFTDMPSYFAINRNAHAPAAILPSGNTLTIDTGVIHLTYTNDGQPFSPTNLSADIRRGNFAGTWRVGQPNTGNLGGTSRTLDGWNGARHLPDGLLSRDGWYLLDDSHSPLLTKNWAEDRPKDASTDWYFFGYGDDYKAALKSLTAISGPVPLPRRYLLGAWYSRYWPYTEDEFKQIVQQYADHDFPLDIIVMDMDWHLTDVPGIPTGSSHQVWTGYTWNTKLIPNPPELLKWFHQHDIAVTLNDHPSDGVWPFETHYPDFMRAMGKDPATHEHLLFDAGDKIYLDTFFKYTHAPLEKEGVDFWWLDWQQYPFTRSIPTLTNLQWLNQYYFQHESGHDKRGVSFSRWAGWGDQRHPIHFSGDANTSFRMLAAEIPFTATAGNVGCFFWSHDIGGHLGTRNEESYARWCQFGAFSAALRSHSTRNAMMDRRPWTYSDWAESSMHDSFHLRSLFFPYTYTAAAESCQNSVPLLRPMYFDFPHTDAAYHQPQQYLFGDNLLVAPITEPGAGPDRLGRQVVWFPPDTVWYDYFTGERFGGAPGTGTETLVAAPINQFPLFIKAGAPIPMRPFTQRMATDPLKELLLRIYPPTPDANNTTTLYEDDGLSQDYTKGKSATTTFSCYRAANHYTITISPTDGSYNGQLPARILTLQLPCIQPPTNILINNSPATADYDPTAHSATIHLGQHNIRKPLTITYDALDDDQSKIQLAAFARRANIAQIPDNATLHSLLALSHTADPAFAAALDAAAHTGAFNKNDNPTGYPETTTIHTYPKETQ